MYTTDLIIAAILLATSSWCLTTFFSTNKYLNKKPLNCPMCLGWWLSLLVFGVETKNTLLTFSLAGLTALTSYLIDKWTIKIL